MKTKTVATRLGEDELALLDDLAGRAGLDRASMTKKLVRCGMAEMRFENAASAYREGRMTLSRAAEVAGISLWDMIARMGEKDLVLQYGVRELDEDLASGPCRPTAQRDG